jgi:indolepyruvate ferredoxin oxidoreductase beta subunit
MAQRGGSVESHIRIDGRYGPLIAPGTADLLIAFDMLEALRYSHFLKDAGRMVVNHRMVVPTSVYVQNLSLPSEEEIISLLSAKNLCLIDADAIARDAGNPLTANVVMLGAASHHMPLRADSLVMAIGRLVPPNTVVINTKAFELGRAAGESC